MIDVNNNEIVKCNYLIFHPNRVVSYFEVNGNFRDWSSAWLEYRNTHWHDLVIISANFSRKYHQNNEYKQRLSRFFSSSNIWKISPSFYSPSFRWQHALWINRVKMRDTSTCLSFGLIDFIRVKNHSIRIFRWSTCGNVSMIWNKEKYILDYLWRYSSSSKKRREAKNVMFVDGLFFF